MGRIVPSRIVFGHCTGGHHRNCPGALNRPDRKPSNFPDAKPPGPRDPALCACACHAGQIPEPPARNAPREVVQGKRDTKLLEQWGQDLLKYGTVSVPAPEDKKACTSIRERLYTAGKRVGIKVGVRVRGGEVVATSRVQVS